MRTPAVVPVVLVALVTALGVAVPEAPAVPAASKSCAPGVQVIGYSDALDKTSVDGVPVAGLSGLAYDHRARRYLALPDHTPATAVVWPLTGLDDLPVPRPRVAGPPIRLRGPDGRALPGRADNEGIAVLPGGELVISSENGPRISVFGNAGHWRYDLPIPDRFRTAPDGRAVRNGSLEGLTATPTGDRVIAAMEKAVAGDEPRTHRFLDYRRRADGRFALVRELRYRTAPGMRVAEIAAYGEDRIAVLEAAYAPRRGNTVVLAASHIGGVGGDDRIRSVGRRPIVDLAQCPTLGARSRESQRNPLLDNYEGMAVAARPGGYAVYLVSDDNYSRRQITRVLALRARLP